MFIGLVERKTIIRFKRMVDFESYINAKDSNCDSEDVAFAGYVYKINTPQFKFLNEVLMPRVLTT